MAERLSLKKESITYTGLFEVKEVIVVIRQWASDTGYWVIDASQNESIRPDGKYVTLDWTIFKKFSDYAKSVFKLHLQFQGVKDVVVERNGKKHKLQEGKILMDFEVILETDYEGRWEAKPVYYVLRTVFEKYVYSPFISRFESSAKADFNSLKASIKSYLNISQFD